MSKKEEGNFEEETSEDKEESELEDILDNEDLEVTLDKNQFQESLQNLKQNNSSTLEQVAEGKQELRGAIFFTPGMSSTSEKGDSLNYSLNEYKEDKSKYNAPSENPELGSTRNFNFRTIGENRTPTSQDFVVLSPESLGRPESSQENYFQPKQFEQDNTMLPFEKKEKIYKEFKR